MCVCLLQWVSENTIMSTQKEFSSQAYYVIHIIAGYLAGLTSLEKKNRNTTNIIQLIKTSKRTVLQYWCIGLTYVKV